MQTEKQTSKKTISKEGFPLADDNMKLWFLLDQARGLVAKARALELKHSKLTCAQASILFLLLGENRGLTIPEISNWNLKAPNSILGLVNRMEKSGLIEKSRDSDKDRIVITVTEKGRQLYTDISRLSLEMLFSVMSEDERQQLKSSLKKIRAKGRELLGIDFKPPFLP